MHASRPNNKVANICLLHSITKKHDTARGKPYKLSAKTNGTTMIYEDCTNSSWQKSTCQDKNLTQSLSYAWLKASVS